MENGLFTRSGKQDLFVKWQKNAFRFAVVVLCTAISWAGAKDLDKFVSFVGSFAWWVQRRVSTLGRILTFQLFDLVFPSVSFIRRCFITKHVRARGRRKWAISP